VFYGTVTSTRDGKFFIESSKRYNATLDAHSIIYHEDHVNMNTTKLKMFKRAVDSGRNKKVVSSEHVGNKAETTGVEDTGCGSTKRDVKESMRREQRELYEERIRTEVNFLSLGSRAKTNKNP
jgi:hypothetical protein